MPQYQRTPQHRYPTLDALTEAIRQPAGTMLITVPDKMRLFGDPTDPAFEKTNIVAIEVPGFGKNKNGVGHAKIHRSIAPTMVQAFEAIRALGLSYVLKEFGPAATFCVRYAKTDKNLVLLQGRPEYKGLSNPDKLSWNVLFAQHDQKHGRLRDPLGSSGTKLDHLSNHCWGAAFDINPAENPLGSGKPFDLPFEIVETLGRFGFYWGGYFRGSGADYMHFQWGRNEPPVAGAGFALPSPHVTFPFGERGKHQSPTKYFFLNEHHGRGGYFPLGLYQNLHGGIHLTPLAASDHEVVEDADLPADASALERELADTEPDEPVADTKGALLPVRAALPGYIVAARLVDPTLYADNEVLRKNVEDQPLGFVLIRHELEPPRKQDQTESSERWPLFSLYMHLAAPNWEATTADETKAQKEFEAAPWLEKFLRMEHGGVVALDPANADELGRTFWASAKFDPKGTSAVPVRGREAPLDRRDPENPERIIGYGKASPDAIAAAIDSFKRGAVVSFDRPALPVGMGEVIGFLGGPGAAGRRYLHWQLFAKPGQGLAKLRELAGQLGVSFGPPVKELRDDNFLEMPSLRNPGAPNEIDACFPSKDPVLNPVITKVPYAKKLVEAFHKGEAFAEGGEQPFHYPTTLRFANPYHFRPEAGADWSVVVTFLADGKPLETKSESLTASGEQLVLKLQVPAAADLVRLRSKHFRLELAPPPLPEGTKADKNAAEKARASVNKARRALWKAVTGRRWRGLVLEHINEWTAENLAKYIQTKLKAAYFESGNGTDRAKLCKELEEKLAPLTWYAAPKVTQNPHGEQTALGDGARQPSIFGDDGAADLPRDGHLESMHPTSALWLLDLLIEEGKVAVHEGWQVDNLIAEAVADDPPFFTVIPPAGGAAIGAEVGLALIQHGYQLSSTCQDSGVAFVAYPDDHEPRILALASYVEGAAVAKVRFPFWRKTEIKVRAQGKDGSGLRDLAPKEKGLTILDLPPPDRTGMQLALVRAATGKPNERLWTGTILVKDACPWALEGYLSFVYWKADASKQPDLTKPGTAGGVLWPVVADRSPDEAHERDGLKIQGDFVIGVAGRKGNPRTARLSADYVLADFMNKKVAEAQGEEFRLALPLVQRLQALRELCKAKTKKEKPLLMTLSFVARSGQALQFTSPSLPALLERATSLPASELFSLEPNPDGKSAQLTYLPLPTTATLTFTTDPGPALQALATAVSTKAGEQVFARPIFLAPNGGHHVFSHLPKPPPVTTDQVITATAEEVFAASAGDCIQLESDVVFPPAHAFGFGPIELSVGRGSLRTTVALLGPGRLWSNARPRITCTIDGTPIVGGARERDTLSEYWYLEKWTQPKARRKQPPAPPQLVKHRWGKTFELKAEATNTKGMPYPPAPVTARFVAVPKLLGIEAKLVGDDVVLTGTAQAMPTSSELGVRCERQDTLGAWHPANKVTNGLDYQRPSSTAPAVWGSVNEDMLFTATVPKTAFGLCNYRFTWYAVSFSEVSGEQAPDLTLTMPMFGDLKIAPVASPSYAGATLGGVAGGEVESEPDVPRIDDEVSDGSR